MVVGGVGGGLGGGSVRVGGDGALLVNLSNYFFGLFTRTRYFILLFFTFIIL